MIHIKAKVKREEGGAVSTRSSEDLIKLEPYKNQYPENFI
jgi:hypothetical protein